jgi:hypothetical protein
MPLKTNEKNENIPTNKHVIFQFSKTIGPKTKAVRAKKDDQ